MADLNCCRYCGQSMPSSRTREGVYLTPTRIRIWDAIKRRPGISSEELAWVIYGCDSQTGRGTVRAHIVHMRNDFMDTSITIKGSSGNGYRIHKMVQKGAYPRSSAMGTTRLA
jgi:DNA-binding response OmpR family regulator